MRLLSPLRSIDSRPTTHLRRPREDGSEDFENEELETGPFAHDFRDDPAWVGVVDYDFRFWGCADFFGDFLDGVHFEEFGEVVSWFWGVRLLVGVIWGGRVFVPVVHSGFLFVGEGVEDFRFLAFGELCHPVDEGGYEDESVER